MRHLSSVAAAPVKEAARPPHTNFWVAPPEHLPAAAGTNRASWDIRYDAPPSVLHSFEINANPGLTPTSPVGALAPPGTYTIKLTVGGQSLVQTVRVTNDPRSRATAAGVRAQVLLQRRIEGAIRVSHDAYQQVAAMRVVLDSLKAPDSTSAAAKAIATFRARFDSIGGEASDLDGPFYDFSDGNKPATDIFSLHIKLVTEFMAQESADFAPTDAMMQGFAGTCRLLTSGVARWQALNATDLPALNAELAKAGLGRVPAAAGMRGPKC